jgi:hypothetical protein
MPGESGTASKTTSSIGRSATTWKTISLHEISA